MRFVKRRMIDQSIVLTCVALIALVILFPLLWMFFSSFKPPQELFFRPPLVFPTTWTVRHYLDLFLMTDFARYFANTFIVAAFACIIGVSVSLTGVYSLSRFHFIAARPFAFIMLTIYMLPPSLLVIPYFEMFHRFGLTNTLTSLTITYIGLTLPFSIWVLRPYIETIPRALEEAAMVDGCTRFQAFRKIIVPQAAPGIITAFIFTFVIIWNELLYALVLIADASKRTVGLAIASLISDDGIWSWGLVNAAGVAATVPILVVFVFLQRYMVSGLTGGAVKG